MGQQPRLVPGHAPVAQAFGVTRAHIEDQAQIRANHRGQFVHVARMADARLNDPEIFIPVRVQHGAGHADLIVVVQGVARGFAAHGQHLGQGFLERGFARRARDAHHLGPGFAAPERRQAAQSPDCIFHQQHGRSHIRQRPRGQHRRRALLYGPGREIMPVRPFARHADKERAGTGLTAVRNHARRHCLSVPIAGGRHQAQMCRHFRSAQAQCSNSRTTS